MIAQAQKRSNGRPPRAGTGATRCGLVVDSHARRAADYPHPPSGHPDDHGGHLRRQKLLRQMGRGRCTGSRKTALPRTWHCGFVRSNVSDDTHTTSEFILTFPCLLQSPRKPAGGGSVPRFGSDTNQKRREPRSQPGTQTQQREKAHPPQAESERGAQLSDDKDGCACAAHTGAEH